MIPCVWTGQHFEPVSGHARRAAELFGPGEVVTLQPVEDRSAASHRHYFASINEAWQNLPEHLAAQYPSPEHLRKRALIQAGYADSQAFVAASRAEAVRLAAFLAPVDPFSLVTLEGAVVTRWTAQSQSQRAMGKKVFQESKDAVLGVLADMIGVSVPVLQQARAA